MKLCTVAAVLLVSLFATSMALPARRIANYRPSSPQRLMVMQRLVAAPARKVHHRSAAFVNADNVAASSGVGDAGAVEQQAAAESVLNSESDVEPYAPAGGQVSAEFEGSYADGGADTAVAGAEEIPADEIPAFAEAPEAPESGAQPELPELPQSGEIPEAPIADNQIFEDEAVPEAVAPAADLPSDDAAKEPKELNFDSPADALPEPAGAPVDGSVEAPVAEDAVPELSAVPEVPELPAVPSVADSAEGAAAAAPADEAPVAAAGVPFAAPAAKPAAVAPPKRYLPPKKKVSVKLESDSADDDAAANSYRPARIPNARRPGKGNTAVANKGKGAKAPLPTGTFFPISFGGTAGGAIAIANSFSTGEGGAATSHAIAYGSPDAARAKGRPSRRRH